MINLISLFKVGGFTFFALFLIAFVCLSFQAAKNKLLLMVPIVLYCLLRTIAYLIVGLGGIKDKTSVSMVGVRFNLFIYWLMVSSFLLFNLRWINNVNKTRWTSKTLYYSITVLTICFVFGIVDAVGTIRYYNNPTSKPNQLMRIASIAYLIISSIEFSSSISLVIKDSLIYQTPKEKVMKLFPSVLFFFRNLSYLLSVQSFSTLDHAQFLAFQFGALTGLEAIIVIFWSFSKLGKSLSSDVPDNIIPINQTKFFANNNNSINGSPEYPTSINDNPEEPEPLNPNQFQNTRPNNQNNYTQLSNQNDSFQSQGNFNTIQPQFNQNYQNSPYNTQPPPQIPHIVQPPNQNAPYHNQSSNQTFPYRQNPNSNPNPNFYPNNPPSHQPYQPLPQNQNYSNPQRFSPPIHQTPNPNIIHQTPNPNIIHQTPNPNIIHQTPNPNIIHQSPNQRPNQAPNNMVFLNTENNSNQDL
ncbi:hypothetical protein BB560_002480 [Smittium megazygosporum]|uniref:Uncharacterized protein n=1 Tax=Smittium megazygosporum TaxID=133381 RepID=A0A2T9ZER5_9FUNG|nr:hypothetical protein BB560_002480 [Smittium megazygosporum]